MSEPEKAEEFFKEGYACAQSILLLYAERYGLDIEAAKRLSSTFGGGMGRLRQKCGALTGAFMVLGLEFGNADPTDLERKFSSYARVRELNDYFQKKYGATDCGAILEQYVTPEQIERREHHQIICHKLVRDVEQWLENNISHSEQECVKQTVGNEIQ